MAKIIRCLHTCTFLLLVFLSTLNKSYAQDTVLNKYGLWVIDKASVYKKTVLIDSVKQMLDIEKHLPDILLDLRYATTTNFMKIKLYPKTSITFLRKPAIEALQKVQQELGTKGLGLKIFDAYRPYSVTKKMWEPVQDDRYAANPKFGSGHNRGVAVDLTLITLKTKEEINMGTGFDNFSDTAHHNFTQLPETVLQNRLLLKTTMEKYGFKALDTEWWHYYLPDAKKYELLDLPFKTLKKLTNN